VAPPVSSQKETTQQLAVSLRRKSELSTLCVKESGVEADNWNEQVANYFKILKKAQAPTGEETFLLRVKPQLDLVNLRNLAAGRKG